MSEAQRQMTWDEVVAQMVVYRNERDALIAAVRRVHAAKGRYHSQIAMCALYALCGLPNDGPMK